MSSVNVISIYVVLKNRPTFDCHVVNVIMNVQIDVTISLCCNCNGGSVGNVTRRKCSATCMRRCRLIARCRYTAFLTSSSWRRWTATGLFLSAEHYDYRKPYVDAGWSSALCCWRGRCHRCNGMLQPTIVTYSSAAPCTAGGPRCPVAASRESVATQTRAEQMFPGGAKLRVECTVENKVQSEIRRSEYVGDVNSDICRPPVFFLNGVVQHVEQFRRWHE